MSQSQSLQRRIRSVKNAKQITKAMEAVAASRMRRVAEAVQGSRLYADLAGDIVQRIAVSQEAAGHIYFQTSEKNHSLYIVFSSDRGLAGAYNANVFSTSLEAFTNSSAAGPNPPAVIVFGKKAARFLAGFSGIELMGEYEGVEDLPSANLFAPVLEAVERGFHDGTISAVNIIYTKFHSPMNQTVVNQQLLPVIAEKSVTDDDSPIPRLVYEFEPGPEVVTEEAVRLYLEAQLMNAKVESSASEYAMRMVAMGNANRNASGLIDDLTLELNVLRQDAITQEIAEITSGANAVGQ